MTSLSSTNAPTALSARLAARRIPGSLLFLVTFARPLLALLVQGLFTVVFLLLKVQSPAVAVRHWWTVYGTLIDLGCLALLFWMTRREGIRLFDLISFDKRKLKTDVLIALGIFLIIFPATVFGGGMLASLLAYGNLNPVFPDGGFVRSLPLWAVLYSRLLWWPIWSLTEELTFQGYALPRLQAFTRSTWFSMALVSIGWSIQHSFLPWINPQHALYLFITFVPLTIASQFIYLRVRRLTPLIIGHWLMDLTSVLLLLQIA